MASVNFDKRSLMSEFNSRRPNQLTIPNEDIIKEYFQAKIVGRGDQYKEYVESDDTIDQGTKEAIDALEDKGSMSDFKNLDEVERELNQKMNKIYSPSNIRRGIDKMEDEFNQQLNTQSGNQGKRLMTDGGVDQDLEDEFGRSDIVIDSINMLERFLKAVANVLMFAGVAVSMLISLAGKLSVGVGIMMLATSPVIILGVGIGAGDWSSALIYVAYSATVAIGGGLGWTGFDKVAKHLDKLHGEVIRS